MSRFTKLIRVKEFDLYQDPESLRWKPDPPWKWFKLPTSLLQDPILRELSNAQFGAYVKLIAMAAETGNRILLDGRWLRDRVQIRLNVVRTLIELGFLVEFELDIDSNEFKELRLIYSGRSSCKRGRKGEENKLKRERKLDSNESQELDAPNKKAPQGPLIGRKDRKKPNRIDPRPFDGIKQRVLDIATKLGTDDASQIQNCIPSYKYSQAQVLEALNQLREDGEL